MNINTIVSDKIKESRLFGVSKPAVLKEIFKVPDEINIKKLHKNIDSYYNTFYIKKSWAKRKLTTEERRQSFLNIEKDIINRLNEIPDGEPADNYRKISVINTEWLKKTQKIFNKILTQILLDKKIRGIKQKSIIPYLHSSVKQRSYSTNAETHIGDKYILAIDLKDFYPSVSKTKICDWFVNEMHLPYDIAMFYAIISTIKGDDNNYKLGQGLSQSATLAYLVNYKLFNYLYEFARDLNIQMSIYVDDIIFSSDSDIPQSFIDKLFGIIKDNGMLIKKQKLNFYKKDSTKKITGVYINGKKTRVANKKHEEFHFQYKALLENIKKIKNIDDYYKIYNLYLKFYGNYQHINMVEKRVHDRYIKFKDEYDAYFPKGVNKKQKNINYRKNNIKNESDRNKINNSFQKLLNKINNN